MTVMILSRGLPSERYKTNGIFEYDQAKALAKAGCRVILAGLDLRSVRRRRRMGFQSLEQDGVSVRLLSVPLGNLPKSLFYWAGEKAYSSLYQRLLKEFGPPDLIHAHFTDLAYLAAKGISRDSVPLVVTEHSSLMNRKELDPQLREAAGFAYGRAAKVIAVSPSLAGHIRENFGIQPVYLPDMVDVSLFPYRPREKDGVFRFLSAGNLLPNKRMDLTIQAFDQAFHGRSGVTLDLYGGGPEEANLKKLVSDLGIGGQVFLHGMQPREEISRALGKTDCFVLASRSETFGTVYIEAMSSGVPVIATRCGGPEAYLNRDNSLVVDVDDLDGMKNAMLEFYSRSDTFDRKAISDYAAGLFSCETVADKLTALYRELIEKRAGQALPIE